MHHKVQKYVHREIQCRESLQREINSEWQRGLRALPPRSLVLFESPPVLLQALDQWRNVLPPERISCAQYSRTQHDGRVDRLHLGTRLLQISLSVRSTL